MIFLKGEVSYCWLCMSLVLAILPDLQHAAAEHETTSVAGDGAKELAEYPAEFFILYQPNTAPGIV